MKKSTYWAASCVALAFCISGAQAANLIVNGDFESTNNGFSSTGTPVGWTSVGHTDGVISYASFGTPAYDGSYFYDTGGFGGPLPGNGDGIEQTVATSIGTLYTLQFGLTGENASGTEFLNVLINGTLVQSFTVPTTGFGTFQSPFVTQTLNYTADSTSSTIRFTVTGSTRGNNDPLLDAISFDEGTTAAPEPSTWVAGLTGLGFLVARKRNLFRRA